MAGIARRGRDGGCCAAVAVLLTVAVWLLLCGEREAFPLYSSCISSRHPALAHHQQRRRRANHCARSSSGSGSDKNGVLLLSKKSNTDEKLKHQESSRSSLKKSLLEAGLDQCASGTQARRILERELDPGSSSRRFGSIAIPPGASVQGISDGDLAIQTRLVNKKYKIMELIELSGNRDMDRASWGVLSVFVASSLAAVAVNQNLPGPEIVRFLVVWLLTFAPLFLVGYGLKDADKLQALLVQVQRMVFPAYRQRMVQHEAGHFLMGHLLGWPIRGYTANAVKNAVSFFPLSDAEKGRDVANQLGFDRPKVRTEEEEDLWPLPGTVNAEDAQFFGPGGRGSGLVQERSVLRKSDKNKQSKYDDFLKLPSQNDPTKAWPYRGFDERTIDQLTVISVAGVCAEILAFGNAEGGVADLNQLRQIFAASAREETMSDREIDNRIRFALGYTLSQLRLNLGALDALAEVMDRNGSVAECVSAIESCKNASGQTSWGGDYELERRKRFQEQAGIIEKNIDTMEDRFAEGKGGGGRKQTFALTGDDPLYLALAVSVVFLAWASAGGLSLH